MLLSYQQQMAAYQAAAAAGVQEPKLPKIDQHVLNPVFGSATRAEEYHCEVSPCWILKRRPRRRDSAGRADGLLRPAATWAVQRPSE